MSEIAASTAPSAEIINTRVQEYRKLPLTAVPGALGVPETDFLRDQLDSLLDRAAAAGVGADINVVNRFAVLAGEVQRHEEDDEEWNEYQPAPAQYDAALAVVANDMREVSPEEAAKIRTAFDAIVASGAAVPIDQGKLHGIVSDALADKRPVITTAKESNDMPDVVSDVEMPDPDADDNPKDGGGDDDEAAEGIAAAQNTVAIEALKLQHPKVEEALRKTREKLGITDAEVAGMSEKSLLDLLGKAGLKVDKKQIQIYYSGVTTLARLQAAPEVKDIVEVVEEAAKQPEAAAEVAEATDTAEVVEEAVKQPEVEVVDTAEEEEATDPEPEPEPIPIIPVASRKRSQTTYQPAPASASPAPPKKPPTPEPAAPPHS